MVRRGTNKQALSADKESESTRNKKLTSSTLALAPALALGNVGAALGPPLAPGHLAQKRKHQNSRVMNNTS